MARQGEVAFQVWLDEETKRMFEVLKAEDLRKTSDMVRILIRQEAARRQALRAAEIQQRGQFDGQIGLPLA